MKLQKQPIMRHLKTIFILVSIAFLIGIVGCKKEPSKTTQVNGTVVDATTFAVIPNATVFLQRENPDCFSCQTGTVDMFTADANGKFAFSFEQNQDFIYSVIASHTNYWESFSGGISIESGEKNKITVTLTPKAYIRVFIKNTNPFDGDDRIGLSGGGGGFFLWNDGGYIYCKSCSW